MSSGPIATDASANGVAASPPPQSNASSTMTYASVISLHQLNIAVIAVLILLVVLVLVLSLAKARSTWLHRRAVLRQRAEAVENLRPVGQRGLLVDGRQGNGVPEELIKLLGQVVAYETAKVGGECESERECIVCLGEYNEGDMVRVLDACHHMFHQDCIDAWLKAHNSCPLCRTVLLPSRSSPSNPEGAEPGQHTHSHHHHSHHHHVHHHHPHHHHHHDPHSAPEQSLPPLDQSDAVPGQVQEVQGQSGYHDSTVDASAAAAVQQGQVLASAEQGGEVGDCGMDASVAVPILEVAVSVEAAAAVKYLEEMTELRERGHTAVEVPEASPSESCISAGRDEGRPP